VMGGPFACRLDGLRDIRLPRGLAARTTSGSPPLAHCGSVHQKGLIASGARRIPRLSTYGLRRLSPTAFHCIPLVLSIYPGDPTPLPTEPIAAYTDRQTHTKNEKDA
jgi:hypothetical protein